MHELHDGLAGIDLNLVVALDALLAECHVTRAAARLGLTQSAASHALGRLRGLLGDPLLVRGPAGMMIPTPLAIRLAPQLRKVLDDLSRVLRGETFDPTTAQRTFHIGASDYVELVMLPQLSARLARLAPRIDIWLHTYNDWGDTELASGALDLVLGPPRHAARPSAAYERVLFTESFTCVMRAEHPLARGRLTLRRYCEVSHLMVAPRGTPGSFVDDALAAVGKTRRVALAVPHFLVVPYVIAASDLLATLASRIAKLFASTLELVTVPPPIEVPKFEIALAWHERNHHDAAHRWLRDQLVAVANELR
jgi:DNA-binding transcriptional LysR family regulator